MPVQIIRNDTASKVDIFIGEKFFTSYIYKLSIEKPILYPINAANGTTITRGFPLNPRPGERMDHPHQLGMWFTFGDVNGIDFWNNSYAIPENEKNKYGRIIHKKISEISSNANAGKLVVSLEWVDYLGNILLNEETTFTFSGNENFRFIERNTKLTAINNKVIFGDNKEGLMAIRVDRAFESPENEPLIYTDSSGKPTQVVAMDNTGKNGLYKSSSGYEGDSVGRRIEAPQRGRQLQAAAVERGAGGPEQDLQVGARVGVQGGEQLVEVRIGRRLRDRDRAAARHGAGAGRALVELDGHVLQRRLGAQQHRRVAVDRAVLLVDVQRHHRDSVAEAHVGDQPHLDPGDRDRLALAGRDRLRGLEVGVDRVVARADHRDPAGNRQPLLREDVAAHEHGDHDQRDDRDEGGRPRRIWSATVRPAVTSVIGRSPRRSSAGPCEAGPL